MNLKLVTKRIDDKTIVWFKTANKYVVLENKTASILQEFANYNTIENIATEQVKQLNIPYEALNLSRNKLSLKQSKKVFFVLFLIVSHSRIWI